MAAITTAFTPFPEAFVRLTPMAKEKKTKKKDSEKKNTSLRLDSKTLKALKIRAIEEETSVQKILETLVEKYLDGDIKLG